MFVSCCLLSFDLPALMPSPMFKQAPDPSLHGSLDLADRTFRPGRYRILFAHHPCSSTFLCPYFVPTDRSGLIRFSGFSDLGDESFDQGQTGLDAVH